MEKYKPLFIKCGCSAEALEVLRYNHSKYGIVNDKGFYISFWKMGSYNLPMNWKERIEWCWSILRNGKPFSNGIIIDDLAADEIINYLNNKN